MSQHVRILYADPPWWYSNRKTGGERKKSLISIPDKEPKFGGGARKHYPLMRDSELLALSGAVRAIMAENSACFMWVTGPRKDFGIDLLKTWGFRYVTAPFVWIKLTNDGTRPRYGPGSYTASNHEEVILGVRGSMPVYEEMMGSVILTPRLEHSQKPKLHRLINQLYPHGRRVEMFARKPAKHWEAIGNAISGRSIDKELDAMAFAINGMKQQLLFGGGFAK